jgi:hypothetical protein
MAGQMSTQLALSIVFVIFRGHAGITFGESSFNLGFRVGIARNQRPGFILYKLASRTGNGAINQLAGIIINNEQVIHFAAHETTVLLDSLRVFRHALFDL